MCTVAQAGAVVGPYTGCNSSLEPYQGYCLPSASPIIVYLPEMISGNSQLVLKTQTHTHSDDVTFADNKLKWGERAIVLCKADRFCCVYQKHEDTHVAEPQPSVLDANDIDSLQRRNSLESSA